MRIEKILGAVKPRFLITFFLLLIATIDLLQGRCILQTLFLETYSLSSNTEFSLLIFHVLNE